MVSLFSGQPDVNAVAIADVDSARLPDSVRLIEERKGRRPTTYRDFRRLLDNESIDVLVVGTPDHWHAIPTIHACQAGKDVYVEKPDGHNMLEGQRMAQAQRKYRRIVQMGTQSRSSGHFQSAISFIRSGQLGRVLVAKAWESARQHPLASLPDSQPPASVDYDMWLGPAPKRPFNKSRFHGNWRWYFDYGTGDLGNDGVHRIDVARWALSTAVEAESNSEMPALPLTVSAIGGKWYFDDPQEWPDTLQVNYEFAVPGISNRILTYEMKIWTPYPYMGDGEGVVLFGDQAYMVIGNRRWRAYEPKGQIIAEDSGNNDGKEHVRNFLDCVRTRKRPNADLESVGHPSSVLCHAGNAAWRTGKKLAIDPKTELFDDDEANTLRSRPEYRKPWVLPDV